MLDPRNQFNIFRLDRNSKTSGGGICIFVKLHLNAITIEIPPTCSTLECVCIEFFCNKGSKTRLINVYRPGNKPSSDAASINSLIHCLNSLCTMDVTCVLTGDLNCACIDWINSSCTNPNQRRFLEAVLDLGFIQFVNHPTRYDNILDLVLCNDPHLIVDVTVLAPFSTSDHSIIEFLINACSSEGVSEKKEALDQYFYCWDKTAWVEMRSFMFYVDWDFYLGNCTSVDECFDNFCFVLHSAISEFVPIKTINTKSKRKGKKSHPKTIRKLLSRKALLWRKYRAKRTKRRKEAFNKIARRCKSLMDKNATLAEKTVLKSANLGTFFRFINSKLSSKSGIGPLRNSLGGYAFTDIDKSELMNMYFSSVCTKDDGSLPPFECRRPAGNILDSVAFDEANIFMILSKLKNSMSAGPDKLPPTLFKNLAGVLAKPIAMICNFCFTIGKLPKVWKSAIVTPVFKKGCSSCVENYRPISLTCVTCKIFESVVKSNMLSFMLENKLLTNAQHGFLAGHSTTSNLLQSMNDWTLSLQSGNFSRVAHVDFSRAFDSVCHSKLLHKLSGYGFKGPLLKIIEAFLEMRTQCVKINGVKSGIQGMVSGVPQGSVLGPLLFVIYINDMVDIFPDKVASKYFADDAKLYTEVLTGNNIDDLQSSLDLLSNWARTWQLSIAYKKCSTIDIAQSKKVDSFCGNNIEGNVLDSKYEVNDLGVLFDNSLSFSPHILQIVCKAKQRVFLLFRVFRTRDIRLLTIAYKSYILPLMDYCSTVWSPTTLENITNLESVQKLFTWRLPGLQFYSYADRLRIVKMPTLELRRLRSDLVLCYKILNGFVVGPPKNYGLILNNRQSRGHSQKLFKEHASVSARRNFFSIRVIDPWNALPAEVIQSGSVCLFKSNLVKYNLTQFLKQNYDMFDQLHV